MSDAQLYKQAGNAVTTKVIEAIGRRLKAFDEKYGHEIETVAWEKENG